MSSDSTPGNTDPFPELKDKPEADEMALDDLFEPDSKPATQEKSGDSNASLSDDPLWANDAGQDTTLKEPQKDLSQGAQDLNETGQGFDDVSDLLAEVVVEEDKLKAKLEDDSLEKGDDLWDAGDAGSDVPLFEEFADDLAEIEQKKSEGYRPPEPNQEKVAEDIVPEQEDVSETQQEKSNAELEQGGEVNKEEGVVSISSGVALIAIAASVVLSAAGVFVFWLLSDVPKPPVPSAVSQPTVSNTPQDIPKELGKRPEKSLAAPGVHEKVATPKGERITLAPFLIPATQHGQPVFLSLQVDLLCENDEVESGLLRKEAWLRDSIYRELKGIEISSNELNPLLQRYKAPLIQRINTDLAPYAVQDVIIIGSLLK